MVAHCLNRIRAEGSHMGNGIVKVDGFVNHHIDPALTAEMGRAFALHFAGAGVSKVEDLKGRKVRVFNKGMEGEFEGAHPSGEQIRELFGTDAVDTNIGDDLTVYIDDETDGKPIGEMHCVSHESLSPIREK